MKQIVVYDVARWSSLILETLGILVGCLQELAMSAQDPEKPSDLASPERPELLREAALGGASGGSQPFWGSQSIGQAAKTPEGDGSSCDLDISDRGMSAGISHHL
jgi:hypothetical protein